MASDVSGNDWRLAIDAIRSPAVAAELDRLKSAVDRDGDLIAHRMTWLMTLDGFLAAGAVALATQRHHFEPQDLAGWSAVLGGLLVVALLSNLSTLYSNVWADRAIREADATFMNMATVDYCVSHVRLGLRLVGRDPANGPQGGRCSLAASGFFTPVEKVLHPWFLLPSTFALVSVVAGTAYSIAEGHWFTVFVPVALTSTTFGLIVALSKQSGASHGGTGGVNTDGERHPCGCKAA